MDIRHLSDTPKTRKALAELLIETVASGGSVSFMHPLAPETADAFWARSLSVAKLPNERIVLGAYDGETLTGTATLVLNCPPNQPHRAEIAKMMVHSAHRGRGIATALVHEAERLAAEHGRTLLTLDTAKIEGAAAFYEKMGFVLAGVIPDYALLPRGGLTGTMIYWKRIGEGV